MRLFIASTFPVEVLRDLNERVARLRPRLPAASWVREGAQHLTYAFLGDQPEQIVEQLHAPLTNALAAGTRFTARVRGCGFFPNSRRPRVGWAGLDPEAEFASIAMRVRDVIGSAGMTLDGVAFKPHLTLMRLRDPWPPASLDLFTRSLRDYESDPFEVATVTLYESRLDPRGAIHTPLQEFQLGKRIRPA
jgi:RNA 2',3'-cyclic 3'-phosphodiesterase